MSLDMIIGYRMQVIKTEKFAADSHVENIETVHLDFGKGAPDVQIIIKFGKNEGRGKKSPHLVNMLGDLVTTGVSRKGTDEECIEVMDILLSNDADIDRIDAAPEEKKDVRLKKIERREERWEKERREKERREKKKIVKKKEVIEKERR